MSLFLRTTRKRLHRHTLLSGSHRVKNTFDSDSAQTVQRAARTSPFLPDTDQRSGAQSPRKNAHSSHSLPSGNTQTPYWFPSLSVRMSTP